MTDTSKVYRLNGNTASDQAESTSLNPGAGNLEMRILIELQVISTLLANSSLPAEDLPLLRQSIADSIS